MKTSKVRLVSWFSLVQAPRRTCANTILNSIYCGAGLILLLHEGMLPLSVTPCSNCIPGAKYLLQPIPECLGYKHKAFHCSNAILSVQQKRDAAGGPGTAAQAQVSAAPKEIPFNPPCSFWGLLCLLLLLEKKFSPEELFGDCGTPPSLPYETLQVLLSLLTSAGFASTQGHYNFAAQRTRLLSSQAAFMAHTRIRSDACQPLHSYHD